MPCCCGDDDDDEFEDEEFYNQHNMANYRQEGEWEEGVKFQPGMTQNYEEQHTMPINAHQQQINPQQMNAHQQAQFQVQSQVSLAEHMQAQRQLIHAISP